MKENFAAPHEHSDAVGVGTPILTGQIVELDYGQGSGKWRVVEISGESGLTTLRQLNQHGDYTGVYSQRSMEFLEDLRRGHEYETGRQGTVQKMGEAAVAGTREPSEPESDLSTSHAPEKEGSSDFLVHTFEAASRLTREWSDEQIDGIYDKYASHRAIGALSYTGMGSKSYFDKHELSAADKAFNDNPDTLGKRYGEDIDALKAKYTKVVKNKNGSERVNVQNNNMIFWQFDSDAFVKRQANGERVAIDKRIYLNPRRTEAVGIYEKLLTQINQLGIECRSKILDARYGGKGGLTSERGDTIVLYGNDANADKLLAIVESIHKANPEAFAGQDVARMPIRIADGVAVGSEPKGFNGSKSLTTHRAQIIDMTANALHEEAKKQNVDLDSDVPRRNRNFRRLIRKAFEANNVNPDNWAFDLK